MVSCDDGEVAMVGKCNRKNGMEGSRSSWWGEQSLNFRAGRLLPWREVRSVPAACMGRRKKNAYVFGNWE